MAMKFLRVIALLVSFAPSAVVAVDEPSCASDDSSPSGLKVYENFMSQADILTIYENQKSSPKTISWEYIDGSLYGASFLTKEHVKRLNQVVHGKSGDVHKARYILTKTISETTLPHHDSDLREDGAIQDSNADVAFVFMNTNPDASFVFGPEDEHVPVKAGDLVTFPGGKFTHYTVVNKGFVQLAGPFSTPYPHLPVVGRSSECPNTVWGWIEYAIHRCFGKIPPCGLEGRRRMSRRWLRDGLYEDVDVAENDEGAAAEE